MAVKGWPGCGQRNQVSYNRRIFGTVQFLKCRLNRRCGFRRAVMLAQMFGSGRDKEPFGDLGGIVDVLEYAPSVGPVWSALDGKGMGQIAEGNPVLRGDAVVEGHDDRTTVCSTLRVQCRLWPMH